MLTSNHFLSSIAMRRRLDNHYNIYLEEAKTMFNTLNVKEMMDVNGGFYYVPKYYKDGSFLGLEQVSNSWGNGGYKCLIKFTPNGKFQKSKKYPWEL